MADAPAAATDDVTLDSPAAAAPAPAAAPYQPPAPDAPRVGGLYGGAPVDSLSEEQVAPTLVAPTAGQVLGATAGQALADLPTVRIGRAIQRFVAGNGIVLGPEQGGDGTAIAPEPTIPKDEANKTYGIPGVLSFDQDVAPSVAQDLYEHHVAEIQRADVLNRNQGGLLQGGLARFVTGGALSMVDPINLAAAFVPGAPEAKVAALLGDAAQGAAGRLAVRAITGATQGIAGSAALQPLDAALKWGDQDDWDMGSAVSSVFWGGVLGGALHAALGAGAGEVHEPMMKGSISSIADTRPVDVAPLLDVHDALSAQNELQMWARGQQRVDSEFEANEQAQAAYSQQLGSRKAALDASSSAAEERLTALRAEAEGIRNDQSNLTDRLQRFDPDPVTQQRLDDIDQELGTAIPAARRLDLQATRTMLTEGAPQPGDIESLRDAQQAAALEKAGQRVGSNLKSAQSRLDALKDKGFNIEKEAQDNGRSYDIQAARIASKEDVLRDLTTRTLKRFAGRAGVNLADEELEGSARGLLAAKPGDTAAAIKQVLDDISSRSKKGAQPLPTEPAEPVDISQGMNALDQQAQQASDRLAANQRDAVPLSDEHVTTDRQNATAIKNAKAISGEPSAIESDIASAEAANADVDAIIAGEKKAGRWTDADDKALEKINDSAKLADGDAKAYQEAAACLAVNMARLG